MRFLTLIVDGSYFIFTRLSSTTLPASFLVLVVLSKIIFLYLKKPIYSRVLQTLKFILNFAAQRMKIVDLPRLWSFAAAFGAKLHIKSRFLPLPLEASRGFFHPARSWRGWFIQQVLLSREYIRKRQLPVCGGELN